jgi:hypothetical protein
MSVVKVEDFFAQSAAGSPYITGTHPSSGPGRVQAGDLIVVMVGARSPSGEGGPMSITAGTDTEPWETLTAFTANSYQSATFCKIATGNEPGKSFHINTPGNNVNIAHIIRLSKSDPMHAWRISSGKSSEGSGDLTDRDVTINDYVVLSGGKILIFDFQNRGSTQSFWLDQASVDGNLLGIPQQIYMGTNVSGSSQRNRIVISDIDGLPGIGSGEDGIPFVPGDIEPPTTPGNLRTTSKTTSTISLAWDASTDNSFVTGYLIYQGSTSVATVDGNTVTYTRSGLNANSNYSFRVRARDAAGNISGYSNQLTVKTNAASAPPPPPPVEDTPAGPPASATNLRLNDRGTGFIKWAWSWQSGGPRDRWGIYKNGSRVGSEPANASTYTWTGLKAGSGYRFGIRAEGPGGNSAIVSRILSTLSPPPPAKKNYSSTYYATWSEHYNSSGQAGALTGNWLYHGYGGYGGNTRSLIGFNLGAIKSNLQGSEILEITLRIHLHHTWWGAGAKFRVGYHKFKSRPGTWNSGNVTLTTTTGTLTPQYVSIPLPASIATYFRAGTIGGIAIGPAPSTSAGYYGYFSPHSSSNPPKLIIRYRK